MKLIQVTPEHLQEIHLWCQHHQCMYPQFAEYRLLVENKGKLLAYCGLHEGNPYMLLESLVTNPGNSARESHAACKLIARFASNIATAKSRVLRATTAVQGVSSLLQSEGYHPQPGYQAHIYVPSMPFQKVHRPSARAKPRTEDSVQPDDSQPGEA